MPERKAGVGAWCRVSGLALYLQHGGSQVRDPGSAGQCLLKRPLSAMQGNEPSLPCLQECKVTACGSELPKNSL